MKKNKNVSPEDERLMDELIEKDKELLKRLAKL